MASLQPTGSYDLLAPNRYRGRVVICIRLGAYWGIGAEPMLLTQRAPMHNGTYCPLS